MKRHVMDEQQIWLQFEGEPHLWYSRFLIYRNMGHTRTFLGAVHTEEADKGSHKRSRKVPGAWDRAIKKWRWKERAETYDRYLEMKEDRQRDLILNTGLALMHNRVAVLKEMGELTIGVVREKAQNKIINAREHEVARQWLAAIAEEKDERSKRKDMEISLEVKASGHLLSIDPTKLTEDELAIIQNIAANIEAREAQ